MRRTLLVVMIIIAGCVTVAALRTSAGCGDTWARSPDTFGGDCGPAWSKSQISKTAHFVVYWADGYSRTINVQDYGECYMGAFTNTKCYPEFNQPYWHSNTSGTGVWNLKTRKAIVNNDGGCTVRNDFEDHYNTHNCPTGSGDCGRTAARASLDVAPSLALPPPDDGGCGGTCVFDPETNSCTSPILIDTSGDGFRLSDAVGGVSFDLDSDGTPEQLAWTIASTDDAWLALDRNGSGTVESGRELFGNYTPQPAPVGSAERNGFLALAVYDRVDTGGNADGVIDAEDAVYSSLRLWQDTNHNGVSEAGELHTLPSLRVESLHLNYKETKRADEYGNQFRYRAKLDDAKGAQVNRWAWDVFLAKAP